MKPSRAQFDAAEERLLNDWRENAVYHWSNRRWFRRHDPERAEFFARTRMQIATAIRAIRAQRKALVCVMCGETIRPGTMNGYECSLTREGWLCGALSHTKHAVGDEP
jgi:hypothetical protein